MHIDESEKGPRTSALKKLISMMGAETGKRLGGLKKPVAASIAVEHDEPDADDLGADGEPCPHCGK